MSQGHASIHRRGWLGIIPWAFRAVTSIVLMAIGLWVSTFFGYLPVPGLEEDARVGSLYLLGGSAASLAAALWSFLRGHPPWSPRALRRLLSCGGIALVAPYSLLRHLVAAVALPGAVAGMIGGLLDRGYRRTK